MTIPKQSELNKKLEFKKSLEKKIDASGSMAEKQICGMVRGAVRKSWMKAPVKLLKLELARIPDMNETTRTKWLFKCECCNNTFKGGDVQVDHIKGEHQLKYISDIESFTRSMLGVTLDDLQILCITCHDEKTYSERYGVSIEEARIMKKVIAWDKANNVSKQKEYLKQRGFSDSEISNGDKRKSAYKSLL